MDEWRVWFVLLLPLHFCFHTEEVVVKTIGREPDVTPICTAATLDIITLIVCKIRREMSGVEECRLLYRHGRDFERECDSRFTLTTENQIVVLQLTNLTPVDSGNYICECSHIHGTDIVNLSITVKGDEETSASKMLIYTAVISTGTATVIVIGVVLGLILRKCHCRDNTKSGSSGLSLCEASYSSDKDNPDNPYISLPEQPEGDLYQTISLAPRRHDQFCQQQYSDCPSGTRNE